MEWNGVKYHISRILFTPNKFIQIWLGAVESSLVEFSQVKYLKDFIP
jgi:hypothetical protein